THAVHFSGAPVLTHIGCNGRAEGRKYRSNDILEFSCRGESRHIDFPVHINRALDNNRSDRSDGKLKRHGDSKSKQSSPGTERNPEILSLQVQDRISFYYVDKTQ